MTDQCPKQHAEDSAEDRLLQRGRIEGPLEMMARQILAHEARLRSLEESRVPVEPKPETTDPAQTCGSVETDGFDPNLKFYNLKFPRCHKYMYCPSCGKRIVSEEDYE